MLQLTLYAGSKTNSRMIIALCRKAKDGQVVMGAKDHNGKRWPTVEATPCLIVRAVKASVDGKSVLLELSGPWIDDEKNKRAVRSIDGKGRKIV